MPKQIPARLKHNLRKIVGPDRLLDEMAALAAYAYDSSLHPGRPDLVLFPQSTEQVANVVRLLNSEKIPYVARGAGTNLSGGSTASRGGAVIALSGMREIIEVNRFNLLARVQPGVTNLQLQEELKQFGCFFAPDPASQRVSTIGGNLAENSGGPHCLKYGVTSNHILGATVVAPDGEILELGGEGLYAPGLDLLGLFVGSEGTLGIATEIVCRVLPLPRAVRTMLAVYDSTDDASQTVSDIIAAGIVPATLEMMDNVVIRAVEEALHAGYPIDAAAVLIIEVDGIEESLAEVIADIEQICRRNHVRDVRVARDEQERDFLWAGRRGAFAAVARLFANYSVSDGTVPRTELPQVLRRVAQIAKKYDLTIGNVFHAGDGNLHPLVFFDARDPHELERVHKAGKEILVACAQAGGTISGEHGVGSEKIGSMSLVFSRDEMELMRRIKHALDPNDVCNPGKILPEVAELSDRVLPKHEAKDLSPTGELGGVPLYRPASAKELADCVGSFCSKNLSLAAVGADTLFSRLPHSEKPDAIVSTRALRSIVEHDADNLTVTVEAGLSLEEVQAELRQKGQFLPLDAPVQATLGGIVSAGLPGVRRHLYGAPRDLVLGLEFVDVFGRTLRAGGKTVKNVAGYDYGKLLIGSWGTLGVVTEITFKLLPLPKFSAAFCAEFERSEQALEAGAQILESDINPSLLVLANRTLTAPQGVSDASEFLLFCGAEGTEAGVMKQIAEMKKIAATASAISEMMTGESYYQILVSLTEAFYPPVNPSSFLSLLLSFRLYQSREAAEMIPRLEEEHGLSAKFICSLAGGFLSVHFQRTEDSARNESVSHVVESIRERLPEASLVVLADKKFSVPSAPVPLIHGGRAPTHWAKTIGHWFDPANQLNPGLKLW